MDDAIFFLSPEGAITELAQAGYVTEDEFQHLLASHPALLAGSQIYPERPRRWLLIAREFGVPDELAAGSRWSLDHLFLDQDGIPTLVEVKRSTDSRIRREVIGQILDYAANAVSYWSVEAMQHRLEQKCTADGVDATRIMEEFLEGETDEATFWERTAVNLKAGRIRMLLVADTIPKEMQRIIEFLNEQMSPAEILGVEIKQYTGGGMKTLVPRVLGKTVNAQAAKRASTTLVGDKQQWDEDSFLSALNDRCGPANEAAGRRILDWARTSATRIWYGKGRRGSLFPILTIGAESFTSFALWTDGTVEVQFQYMKSWPPFDRIEKREELLSRLNDLEGVAIAHDRLDKRPNFPISLLIRNNALNRFLQLFEDYFAELRKMRAY